MGALAHCTRTATARARTPVTALRIGRDALTEVARATPSLLIDVIGRMGDRMRKFNGAIGLYTHALAALERHEFDPALLDELRNPIPDLADFGQTFGRMAEQIILRRQRDDEMASAAVIQRALLPKVDEFAAETGLDVSATMTPARDVGGDFFDLVRLADGRVAIGVGDVCGKGVPAALFMGITRTLIRINLRETPDLPGAILKANAYLANNNAAELFATLLYAAFDPRSGEVEYCSCGHLPALIRRADGAVEALPAGGLPVGLFDHAEDEGASRRNARAISSFSTPTASPKRRTPKRASSARSGCSISSRGATARALPSGSRASTTPCAHSREASRNSTTSPVSHSLTGAGAPKFDPRSKPVRKSGGRSRTARRT